MRFLKNGFAVFLEGGEDEDGMPSALGGRIVIRDEESDNPTDVYL